MRSYCYWIGLLLITLAALAIYKWPGLVNRPRPEMVSFSYEPRDAELYTPGAEAAEFRQQLLQLGIELPEGSTLKWSGTYGRRYSRQPSQTHKFGPSFDLSTTWEQHRKILRHDPFTQLQLNYASGMIVTDLQCKVGGRMFGFLEFSNLEFTRSADPPRVLDNRSPYSEFFYGCKDASYSVTNRWLGFGFAPKANAITFHYPVWTLMLFLTLAPYTIVFFLRRPAMRAVGIFIPGSARCERRRSS